MRKKYLPSSVVLQGGREGERERYTDFRELV
jgi:hypothetical protein